MQMLQMLSRLRKVWAIGRNAPTSETEGASWRSGCVLEIAHAQDWPQRLLACLTIHDVPILEDLKHIFPDNVEELIVQAIEKWKEQSWLRLAKL